MTTTSAILAERWETNAMNETAQQYIQRITAHVEGKQPLAVQAATAKKLERIIKGLPTAKLRKRPAPDKWSVNEIPRTSRRYGNRRRFSYEIDSGRAGGDSHCSGRSGFLGDERA